MRRYGSEDNERWVGFEHRPGDIVISTRSKCGTTLVQMMCALVVFQDPDLPAPLGEISPWLDWSVEPADVVRARLAAQQHRRIIKTHTPLDGLPLHRDVTYIVVGRHPLDVAVSLYHHVSNIDDRAHTAGDPRLAPSRIGWAFWSLMRIARSRSEISMHPQPVELVEVSIDDADQAYWIPPTRPLGAARLRPDR